MNDKPGKVEPLDVLGFLEGMTCVLENQLQAIRAMIQILREREAATKALPGPKPRRRGKGKPGKG